MILGSYRIYAKTPPGPEGPEGCPAGHCGSSDGHGGSSPGQPGPGIGPRPQHGQGWGDNVESNIAPCQENEGSNQEADDKGNERSEKVPQSNLRAGVKFKYERMFVLGFFPIPLSHAPKKLDFLKKYCLSHWVTATQICFVCRTESLRQTDFCLLHWVTVTNKNCICSQKDAKKGQEYWTICYFLHFFALFVPFRQFLCIFFIYFFLHS